MSTETKTSFDVLIVGAGPAGTHLAHLVAHQGARVGIMEKSQVPRDKICGGGVTRKAIDLLDVDLNPVVHHWIHGAYLSFCDRISVLKNVDPPVGCTVLRREFDSFLLDRARASGAQVLTQTQFLDANETPGFVDVQTNRGAYRSQLLIGADGIASAVRAKVLGKSIVRYVPALEALVPLSQSLQAQFDGRVLFDFGAMRRGYGWIFPKRDHLNIGVYSPFGGDRLREQLSAFIARHSSSDRHLDTPYLGFPIPLRNERQKFQTRRVWLLGDAAGLADGLFGEGIYFALKSATLAARALGETGLTANGTRYSELLREELLPELRASLWLGKALFAAPAFAYRRLVCNSKVADRFAGLISGSVGYRECLRKTLAGAPLWLFSRPKVLPENVTTQPPSP